MARIKIITDSASDLPPELVAAHEIGMVPLEVRVPDVEPDRLRAISAEEFWRVMASSHGMAETAAPAPGEFVAAFEQARHDGYDGVCCVTISSGLSGTYQSARSALGELGGFPVEIVDSRLASMGEGLAVLEAAGAATGGADLDVVAATAVSAADATAVYATLDTLENLRRGGRIGSAQAFFGSLLAIKPVVEMRDGVVEGESRQRTRARSLRYLVDKVRAAGSPRQLAVVHADADDLDVFLDLLAEVHPRSDTIVTFVGPVIGSHTGKGTIGVCLERS